MAIHVQRRAFVGALGAAVAWPLTARATASDANGWISASRLVLALVTAWTCGSFG
jgi:hypothetical protein